MKKAQKINWKLRFKNKVWVTGFVSQTLLLIQAALVGLESLGAIDLNMESMDAWLAWVTGLVNVVLAYLSYLGLVVDPTVNGIGDSMKVLNRTEPISEEKKNNLH